MLKKLLTKTLLVAAGLCVGSNAWGQVTPYSNDYEDATPNVDWVSGNTGRYTVAIEGTTDHYLHVGAVGNGSNGTTITSSATNGKVAAGTNFYMSFDLILEGCSDGSTRHAIFYIYDKNNSQNTPILKIYQNAGGEFTEWTINNNTALTTGGKGTSNWYNYVLTRIGTKEYLTVTKKSDSSKVLDMVELTNLSNDGGLGNMLFETNRYYAGLYVDNVVLRALDAPAFTLSTTEVTPEVEGSSIVNVSGITGTVSVSSDNPSVATATYNNGEITINGVASGVAYITVVAINDGAKTTQTITATVGTVATTTVTINYKSGSTSIADPVTINDVTVGSTLTASDITYDDVIYGAGVRYVDPTPDQTIPYTVVENGVVNINYTAQAAVTNVKKIVKAGNVTVSTTDVAQDGKYVGDNINFSYSNYINYNGTLYSKAANSQTFNQSFTLTATDQECILAYTATNITNVVYHSEGENITGATATSAGGNMNARSSNRQCGYTTSDLTLINLPAGSYKATAVMYSNSSGGATLHFQYGDTPYDEVVSGASNWSTQTEEFSLLSAADFKWLISGDSKNGLDLIYIQKTAGPITLNGSYYSTFSNAQSVQITGATAYVAKVEGDELVLTKVNDNNIVPAGTGVILKGEKNVAVSYAVTDASAGDVLDNDLKPVLATIACPTNKDIYVLHGDEFWRYTGANLVAGKAYLDLSSNPSKLRMTFADDDATAIKSVESEQAENGAIYNLAGQRVGKDYKGIVIKNGKKFMNK